MKLRMGIAPFHVSLSFALVADRKSTRLNSSHSQISYAVFCLKKKKIPHGFTEVLGVRRGGTDHNSQRPKQTQHGGTTFDRIYRLKETASLHAMLYLSPSCRC